MINVENISVTGFDAAIRGMRNPMNSWDKSDTLYCDRVDCNPDRTCPYYNEYGCDGSDGGIVLGKNDRDLMRKLFKAGTEHRKYLRMIHVSMDITAPLYWWKEFDTYKIGTTANSCSTMHKLTAKDFTIYDFSHEHLDALGMVLLEKIICQLNGFREEYLSNHDKSAWWQMIQLLPASYNQRRTVDMNYETVVSIISQRTGHKLDEWNHLVETLKDLPYVQEIMKGSEKE